MNATFIMIDGTAVPFGKHGDKFTTAKILFESGVSAREVARKLSMGKNTATKILSIIGTPKCKCGIALKDHKGWCTYRFQESEKRKQFMFGWQEQKLRFNKEALLIFNKIITTYPSLDTLTAQLDTDEKCREFLELQRWNGTPCCIFCSSTKVTRLIKRGRFQCNEKECRKQFSVTVGTVFENCKVTLRQYFIAIHKIMAVKEKINSSELARELNITQNNAWRLIHRCLWIILDKLPKLTWSQRGSSHGGKKKEKFIRYIPKKKPTEVNFENAIFWLEDKIFDRCKMYARDYQNARMLQSEVYESAWMRHHEFKGTSFEDFEEWLYPIIKYESKKQAHSKYGKESTNYYKVYEDGEQIERGFVQPDVLFENEIKLSL